FMQLVASVSITSTPSDVPDAPEPLAIRSPVTKFPPPGSRPPNATSAISPAEGAGTRSGITSARAEMIDPVIRLIVEVRAFTGAGSVGLTRLPSGRCSDIGRKHPALVGIAGSVSARIAKHAAANEPDGTQFNGPRT